MRLKVLIPLIAVAVIAIVWPVVHVRRAHARNLHEAEFLAVLDAYADQIKIGMNRSDAETIIHQKDISFTRDIIQGGGLDDLITIGHEDPPTFCRNDDMYVRVRFSSSTHPLATASPTDKVQQVDLYERPRNCL